MAFGTRVFSQHQEEEEDSSPIASHTLIAQWVLYTRIAERFSSRENTIDSTH